MINLAKSNIYFSDMSNEEKAQLVDAINIEVESLPFKYLAVLIMAEKLKVEDYKPLIDKICRLNFFLEK